MLNLFKKKPSEKAIVALDIGTDNVKACLFTVEERQNMAGELIGRRGMVKGVGKVAQRTGDMQSNSITDIASVVRSTKEAIRLASQEAGLQPEKLVLGIAGEFVKGATSTISFQREDPESKINIAELRNIVHKLQWRAFAEVRKELSEETGFPEIDVKLVNSTIVDVRIDRYKVTNPLGFQGKEVQMSIFNSFAPLVHYGALQSIADDLDLELLSVVSEPFALSRCIEAEEGGLSALFIDVGGGATDIALVTNGSVVGTKMFGIGGRTFTKRLSVELNISFEEAEKLKLAYTSDRLEQKSKKIISDIINEDLEVWMEGITLSLSEFKNLEVLPSKILLSGGGTYLPEIKTTLNTTKWYKKLPFARTPQASYITPKDLRNVVDETKKIKEREDIMPLALVNAGVELMGEETIVQKVLRKVIGIMKV
ncbi:MAG: hypothetical protein HY982_02015 [Candidatus Magasanikbacteria bacterium]|nr:hypothetical protein [Candidatus Magasanikbacteria bacterium]